MYLHWLDHLRLKLEQLCAFHAVPLGVAVGWIEVESGGRLQEVTDLGERGYFQLSPEESRSLHVDHNRLSTDSDYSLESGFQLVSYYHKIACSMIRNTAIDKGSEYAWRLTKFAHSIGAGAAAIIFGHSGAQTWMQFADYCAEHDVHYTAKLKHSPTRWTIFVDRMFDIGRPYGVESLVCAPGNGIV